MLNKSFEKHLGNSVKSMAELKDLEDKLNSNLSKISAIRIFSWFFFTIFWIISIWTLLQQTIWLHKFQFFALLYLNYYLCLFSLFVSCIIIFPIAKYVDKRRLIVNIILEFDNAGQRKIIECCNIINQRIVTAKTSLLVKSTKSTYYKYSAGAFETLDTISLRQKINSAYRLSSRINQYSLECDSLQITFIGNIVLVLDWCSRRFSAYQSFNVYGSINHFPFIWEDKVPIDSHILEYTWRHPNKNGRPDQRFKDNYKIPVLSFWSLEIELNEQARQILISDSLIGEEIAKLIENLKQELNHQEIINRENQEHNNEPKTKS
ncbi:hypothetical protein [Leptospira interrogans]|uniref:Uncharacterized protein n=2 Tax=Leptospira interrogans TaxID=173 RepID=A0AAP9WLC1_LEPIR|nr:hypothetical protein [Leptospira interrogans]EKR16931.1 hypothetical protein LEP1GSC019_3589 [Leptospira interrogans serovar Pyrogenes str. 2006006960]EKR28461.1 hypothetical protein LEP1GSC087_1817 [Leptospira interrogans serovar Bataviae str. L1111]EMN72525.1 hypothetical protein LEP1GSC100_0436 [Leptospira interrogans serovar Bataviae str. UI 08561]QOI50412.1 hypothetical protein Lepto1489_08105 [Leptospira interrogans serovar Bataviae]